MDIRYLDNKLRNLTHKLKKLNRYYVVLILFVILGIFLSILPFIIIPLINTELIWAKGYCGIPEGCPKPDYFTLPNNDLIQNKYDLIVAGWYPYDCSFKFEHIGTVREYIINYITNEDSVMRRTLKMIPGDYRILGDFDHFSIELWEHGIIPYGLDSLYYTTSVCTTAVFFGSFGIVFIRKKLQLKRTRRRVMMRNCVE